LIQLFRNPSYDFIGKRRYAYMLSGVILLIGIGSLVFQGLRYDIDFTGGTLLQVRFERTPGVAAIRGALAQVQLGDSVIQEFGDPHEFIVRVPLTAGASEEISRRVQAGLSRDSALGPFEIRRAEFVGPLVGLELQQQAVYAVLFAVIGILAYIVWRFDSRGDIALMIAVIGLLASMPFWFEVSHQVRLRAVFFTLIGMIAILAYVAVRFDLRGGVAAIAAVFHDVIICLGALSLTHRDFSLPVLAALLTVIGYSVNDTIVAYDRLRENRGKLVARSQSFADQMNAAVNQTLSRTVLTALTTFFSTAILLFLGGRVLEDFAFVLFVGVITGTYSTIYISASLVVDWTQHVEGRVARVKKGVAKVRSRV
jgi:preprotein translocase subunit SecF